MIYNESINSHNSHLQEFCIVLVCVSGEPSDQPDSLSKASDGRVGVVAEPPFLKLKTFLFLNFNAPPHPVLLVLVVEMALDPPLSPAITFG